MKRRVRETATDVVGRTTQDHPTGMPLLLDTHVWIWWLIGDASKFAPRTRKLLQHASERGELLVSDISYWEVAVKAAKGKLRLPMDVEVWLDRATTAAGFRHCPITREVLLHSTRLVGHLHADPADRMLIATAQLLGVPMVTADKAIIAYAERYSGLRVIDVRRT